MVTTVWGGRLFLLNKYAWMTVKTVTRAGEDSLPATPLVCVCVCGGVDLLLVSQGTVVVCFGIRGTGSGETGPCKRRLAIGATQLCASEAWEPKVLEDVLDCNNPHHDLCSLSPPLTPASSGQLNKLPNPQLYLMLASREEKPKCVCVGVAQTLFWIELCKPRLEVCVPSNTETLPSFIQVGEVVLTEPRL